MALGQILAAVIFLLMFGVIIWGRIHRYIPALGGAALTIIIVFLIVERDPSMIISTLNVGQIIHFNFWVPGEQHVESQGVNWQTIIFIAGMMVMVEGLGKVGFFRWLCLLLARMVNYQVVPILVVFMLLSGFLSMFIDSITVLLFLASVTIELARLLKFDPVPVIIAEIFAANVGGSATMSGDPPNIIIGTAFGYTFTDFLQNTGPISWLCMIVTLVLFLFMFRKILKQSQEKNAGGLPSQYPEPREAITDHGLFKINVGIFIFAIILLVTHAESGISVALIGVIAAVLTMISTRKYFGHVMQGVDWRTLLFFIGLFICVGGLEETGVLEMLAHYIGDISGGNIFLIIPIILWVSAMASAIVDNIPFAATMVPVIKGLSQTAGIPLPTLAWTLALGTDIGGNATPIGASANVVGTAISEREGYPIGWGRFIKYAGPAMILVVAICWGMLLVLHT